MARTVILSPGTAEAVSTNVVVAPGEMLTLSIYSLQDTAIPAAAMFLVRQETPGADNVVAGLNNHNRVVVLTGPGTYRVARPAFSGAAFGVFAEGV